MIKKLALVAGSVIAALSLAPAASAEVAPLADCQHSGGSGRVVSEAPVEGGSTVGTIQLCRDSGYNYWGFLILNNPPTVAQNGQVFLRRFHNGTPSPSTPFTCDSLGGNGRILPVPPQTRCWTPKIEGSAGAWTFEAEGRLYRPRTGAIAARGYTARTR